MTKEEFIATLNMLSNEKFARFCRAFLEELGLQHVHLENGNDSNLVGQGAISLGVVIYWFQINTLRRDGSVTANALIELRKKALTHIDKGMFFTTGTFARNAKKEARKKGKFPIDLVDGKNWAYRTNLMQLTKFKDMNGNLVFHTANSDTIDQKNKLP